MRNSGVINVPGSHTPVHVAQLFKRQHRRHPVDPEAAVQVSVGKCTDVIEQRFAQNRNVDTNGRAS